MATKVETFFSSLGDPKAALALIDPEAVFIAARAKDYDALPVYGSYRGHQGFLDFAGMLRASFETSHFFIDEVLENDETGFAAGRFRHKVKATNAVFESHWAAKIGFRKGLIVEYRFYEDTAALEEAFGVRTVCRETAVT